MATAFPIPLENFFDLIRFTSLDFQLGEAMEVNETAGGEVLAARVGQNLWSGKVSVVQAHYRTQEVIQSKLDLLRRPGASFLIGDRFGQYPQGDPDGSVLGVTAVTVESVQPNNRVLRLQGAPDGYQVSAGDHFSVTYGSSPVKYAYFRVVAGSTFSNTYSPPRTGDIEVQPFISTSISAGDSVRLVRPHLKAVYVPDTMAGGSRFSVNLQSAIQFSWQQTLR